MKIYYVYILASDKNGTLYVGFTSNLSRRVFEHKNKLLIGFTSKYNVNKLVHVEQYINIANARAREEQLKNWKRQWKIDLIYKHNPNWIDIPLI